MTRLNANTLSGIWAGVTLSWDSQDQLDETIYRINSERLCQSGVSGIYTSGSTGEFYALDYEEFCRMVDIQAELCGKHGTPLQIGCCADATRKTIKLLEYVARKREVGAAQVVLPYWMEVDDRELLRFFKDLYTACPELPLVHYNIPRAKRFLFGADYLRIVDVAPTLIGVKFTFANTYFGELQDSINLTPQIAYFVGESVLASAMMMGAKGCYSSLVCTRPATMISMYEAAAGGRWPEAIAMQGVIVRFFNRLEEMLRDRGEGLIDPVADKGLAVASKFVVGSQFTRAPYIGWSDNTVAAVREWLIRNYPEFVYECSRDPVG
jgi:dihydrodipicolinate synthase/N-acetylneuraminate lyase